MLFCRRCHRYDCFLHKDKPVTPDLNKPLKNFNLNYRPCNFHCYRRNPKSSYQHRRTKIELKRSNSELSDNTICKNPPNGFHSKRPKSNMIKTEEISSTIDLKFYPNGFLFKPSLKRKLNDEISSWLPSEKSLFRVFHTIYNNNICMIADLLDKPCSQVYTFHLNEIKINEKNLYLQRQLPIASTSFSAIPSMVSSDSIDMKINGDYKKKKINGIAINTNNVDELTEDDTKICNGNDNPQSVRIFLMMGTIKLIHIK